MKTAQFSANNSLYIANGAK